MKKYPLQTFERSSALLLLLAPLREDVLDLNVQVVPERELKPLELVAAGGRVTARVHEVGADVVAPEDVLDAPLRDRTLSLVVHPHRGRVGDKLLLRPARRDDALVVRPHEQINEHGETLP